MFGMLCFSVGWILQVTNVTDHNQKVNPASSKLFFNLEGLVIGRRDQYIIVLHLSRHVQRRLPSQQKWVPNANATCTVKNFSNGRVGFVGARFEWNVIRVMTCGWTQWITNRVLRISCSDLLLSEAGWKQGPIMNHSFYAKSTIPTIVDPGFLHQIPWTWICINQPWQPVKHSSRVGGWWTTLANPSYSHPINDV